MNQLSVDHVIDDREGEEKESSCVISPFLSEQRTEKKRREKKRGGLDLCHVHS